MNRKTRGKNWFFFSSHLFYTVIGNNKKKKKNEEKRESAHSYLVQNRIALKFFHGYITEVLSLSPPPRLLVYNKNVFLSRFQLQYIVYLNSWMWFSHYNMRKYRCNAQSIRKKKTIFEEIVCYYIMVTDMQ